MPPFPAAPPEKQEKARHENRPETQYADCPPPGEKLQQEFGQERGGNEGCIGGQFMDGHGLSPMFFSDEFGETGNPRGEINPGKDPDEYQTGMDRPNRGEMGNQNQRDAPHHSRKGNRETMGQERGKETRAQETDAIPESHKKEERPCLAVPQAQFPLHDGQKRGHDNPGDEIQVKNENQEKKREDRKRSG